MVKVLHFHWREQRSILGWGAKFPHAATKIGVAKKKKRKEK